MNSKKRFSKDKAENLFKIAQKYAGINTEQMPVDKVNDDFNNWISLINDAKIMDLIALTSMLSSREDSTSRKIKALRESVISQIAFLNASQISETMERLDKTATRLTIVSLVLSIVGIIFAVLQFIH